MNVSQDNVLLSDKVMAMHRDFYSSPSKTNDKGDIQITNMQMRPHVCVWAHDTATRRFDFLGIETIFAQHHSVDARQLSLHSLCNHSCLGYQGLRGLLRKRLQGNRRREMGRRSAGL